MATNNPTVGTTFNPSDPELINLLSRKIPGIAQNSQGQYIIVDRDVYAETPYDLVARLVPAPGTGVGTGKNGVVYLYSPLRYTSQSRRGNRSRVVGASRKGTWHYESRKRVQGSSHAGYRTYFSYVEKRGSENVKLGWSMMQYSIDGREDIVLCKVYQPPQGLSRSARAALQGMENTLMADGGEDLHHVANDATNAVLQEMQSLLMSDSGGEHQHHPANATVQTTAFRRHDNELGSTDNAVLSAGPSHPRLGLDHGFNFPAETDGAITFNADAAAATAVRGDASNAMLSPGLGNNAAASAMLDDMFGLTFFRNMHDARLFNDAAAAAAAAMRGDAGNDMLSPGLGHNAAASAMLAFTFLSKMHDARRLFNDAAAVAATDVRGDAGNAMLSPGLGHNAAASGMLDDMLAPARLGGGRDHDFTFLGDTNGAINFNAAAVAATDVRGGTGNAMLSPGLGHNAAASDMLAPARLGGGHDHGFTFLGDTNGAINFNAAAVAATDVRGDAGNAMLSPGLGHNAAISGMLDDMLVSSRLGGGHDHGFTFLGDTGGVRLFNDAAAAMARLTYDFAVPVLSEVNQAVLGRSQCRHASGGAAAYAVGTHHLTDNMQMVNSQGSNDDDLLRHLSAAINHIVAAATHVRGRLASTQRTGP